MPCGERPAVTVTRTPRGWAVISPAGTEPVEDLVDALSFADLVAEEFGTPLEPDRTARRSARGPAPAPAEDVADVDPRITALERTVAQLEHALAARVTTERAIGVLAERHGTSARVAFEALRRDARSHGRPVHELARSVLDSLHTDAEPTRAPAVGLHLAPDAAVDPAVDPAVLPGRRRRVPRTPSGTTGPGSVADARS